MYFFFKRLFDVIFSILILILLCPIIFFFSFIIYFQMGKPIFFSQLRPGKNKKLFKIYKFRTMIDNSEMTDEERVTSLGLLLRKTSIDEIPQIFNVIRGDMSLIGPRPLLVEYNDHYSEEQNKRFNVRPGISGLAQVSGRNTLNWEDKFKLDVEYVDNISFYMDLKIFFRTLFVIIGASGFKKSGEEKTFLESKHEK